MTADQLAAALGIKRRTLFDWKKRHAGAPESFDDLAAWQTFAARVRGRSAAENLTHPKRAACASARLKRATCASASPRRKPESIRANVAPIRSEERRERDEDYVARQFEDLGDVERLEQLDDGRCSPEDKRRQEILKLKLQNLQEFQSYKLKARQLYDGKEAIDTFTRCATAAMAKVLEVPYLVADKCAGKSALFIAEAMAAELKRALRECATLPKEFLERQP